jgi:Carbohydrate-selective porin, OprB family
VWDWFDGNKYAHEPRSDFMNWALIDTATFDYAADSWGYTYGATVEWYQGPWTWRGCFCDLSIVPNSPELDPTFKQFQWIGEIEHRHELWGQPGKIIVTGFLSRGRMGRFDDALNLAEETGTTPDTSLVRHYASRGCIGLSVEQQVSADLGVFARAGWADGNIEPYEFTDADRTMAAGLSLSGQRWGRPNDTFGLAGVVNGISAIHAAYLDAGGLVSWSATDSCRILVRNKSSRPIQLPGWLLACHSGLSVHRKPRLQPRPGSGFDHRHAAARAILRLPFLCPGQNRGAAHHHQIGIPQSARKGLSEPGPRPERVRSYPPCCCLPRRHSGAIEARKLDFRS